MNLKQLHQLYLSSNGICTDTRQIKPKEIFVALKGHNFNGNKYADEALEKGALKAIVDEDFKDMTHKIKVSNSLKTLQDLASFHRDFLQIPIIGITGSNGKTTTKRLIHAVLEQKFNVQSTEGNLNNHIGVPLSLLKLNENTEIGIIEMGANHQKEIAFLSKIAKPDFGYITNFGKAHLEGFGGVEGVIKGKSELYDFLNKHQKLAFVNADDKKQMMKLRNAKIYSFGEAKHADLNIYFKSANPFVELEFEGVSVKSKLIGEYNFKNIAAAVGIGYYFDVPVLKIKSAIQNFEAKDNRSQIKITSYNTLISDAYNANPSSMEVALKSFDAYQSDYKVAILGDMFELGKNQLEEHQHIAKLATDLNIDRVIFCGEIFNEALDSDKFEVFKNFDNLKQNLQKHPIKKAHILIKASRGMALERLHDIL
ncbi:UDP-N-acetylmuramoyl-tripeptide--D-alanyl-D-alanine ligase [Psychroflexus sp. MBR-150]|jgi:UDP-N-acetylmuramoyl-tripeptide--D-alanyl-D-alanine ligase